MWRDLDAIAWPDSQTLLENGLVAHLLGEGSPAIPEPPLASDDEPIDRDIDLASAIHVVDADPAWRLERERIGKLFEHCKVWSSRNAEIADSVIEHAWTFDVGPVRHAIASHGSSLLRVFIRAYRQAVADLRGLCHGRPPGRREDRLTLLDKLISAQAARRHINDEGEFG